MRGFVFGLAAAFAIVTGLHAAGAAPSLRSPASATTIVPAKHHCPKGERWVPAGYASGSKYRVGHCAPA